jgi:dephospho-CoA kinase
MEAKKGIAVHNIELDTIGHQIMGGLKEPRYAEVREEIVKSFGEVIRSDNGSVNRKILGEIVFNEPKKLERLNKIMYKPLIVRLRRELYGKKGLILFNAALIAESDMSYLCNNNVVLLHVDKQSQERRLKERGLTTEQIRRRLVSQYSFEQKKIKLQERIEKDRQGRLWVLENSDGSEPAEIESLFDKIVEELNIQDKKE